MEFVSEYTNKASSMNIFDAASKVWHRRGVVQLIPEALRGNFKNRSAFLDYLDGEIYPIADFVEKDVPDVVFMDIEMPEMDGITATRKAIETYPQLNVVALSMYGNENYYTQVINAGAKGFILKNSDIQDVENAIQNVMSGNNYFSHEIFQRLIHGLGRKQQKSSSAELSTREEEIVFLICKGLSNQEIADKLYLSKRTVDKHRENILHKTQSKNTAGIVMYAVKNGIVEV